jgi:hypothetical protein
MTNWHGYLLIRDIPPGWDNNLLWHDIKGIGTQAHSQPSHITHMRVSLDGRSAIIESEFEEEEITRDALIQMVADILGLNPGQVDASLNITLMGGDTATWEESRQATLAFIAANRAQWEPDV